MTFNMFNPNIEMLTALAITAAVGTALRHLYRRLTRASIAHIRGPKSPSFILGHMMDLVRGQAAEVELQWRAEFGDIIKFKGIFGVSIGFSMATNFSFNAVLKEVLRYHSVAINLNRVSANDDVLPLSKPIMTVTGDVINELPIPKGTMIFTPITLYNRNPDVFGNDAHVFNPERWLKFDVRKETAVGVFGNLMSFSAGVRSCIGYKFAVAELQSFMFELIGNFEFETTPECEKIQKIAALVAIPTIEGQVEKGAQLPLRIRIASIGRNTTN